MSENGPKVEFALGSQVSPGHYFKSSFARSFVTNCRDAKSLNLDYLDNGTITEESESNLFSDTKNNNFFSLMNFEEPPPEPVKSSGPQSSSWQTFNETISSNVDNAEMDKLRKQCQTLTEENRRLAESLQANQVPRVQVIDNVFLQTQIDTLQWQLKQTEANRQMYRSLMGQVVRFLERARKSLDILHEKSNPKGKIARVPRSRSVHAIDEDITMKQDREQNDLSCSTNSRSNVVSSRFTRAKSVAQISPQTTTGFREFTWSVLRKNDPGHCTPPRNKQQQSSTNSLMALDELNKTHEGVVYTRPKHPAEIDPDNVPPEKLSQEAFRLMRTVQSLLAMREPDLAMVSSNDEDVLSSSPLLDHELTSLRTSSFANSTILHDTISYNGGCSSSDRGSVESGAESERTSFAKSTISNSSIMESSITSSSTLQSLLPRARRSLDATSLNSGSGKSDVTKEDDEDEETRTNLSKISKSSSTLSQSSSSASRKLFESSRDSSCSTSTPNRRAAKKIEKKSENSRWSRSKMRPKPANSVSSAEDESGFSSMSSFQEVGLPIGFSGATTPIKGCHTEIGLPEVPLDKIHHRRWSSTPVEIQAMFKRHSAHFTGSTSNSESLSVWV